MSFDSESIMRAFTYAS